MHLTDKEQKIWQRLSPLFRPNGTLDKNALSLYLRRTIERIVDYDDEGIDNNVMDGTLLGTVLKHTPVTMGETAFALYYKHLRLSDADGMHQWLHDMAQERARDLAIWLKKACTTLSFSEKAMVWKDAKTWLPGRDITHFIPASLLKSSFASLFQGFNPPSCDVPFFCELGHELAMSGPTDKHRELGQQLLFESFCVGYFAERKEKKPKEKYAVTFNSNALALVAGKVPPLEIGHFLDKLGKVSFHPAIYWDTLHFALETMQDTDNTTQTRGWAQELVLNVLSKEQDYRQHRRISNRHIQALAAIHGASMDDDFRDCIEQALYSFGHNHEARDWMMNLWVTLQKESPELLGGIVNKVQEGMSADAWRVAQHALLFGNGALQTDYDFSIHSLKEQTELHQWFFDRTKSEDLLALVQRSLALGNPANVVESLGRLDCTPQVIDCLRHSPLPLQAILGMLYCAVQEFDPHGTVDDDTVDPLQAWDPLPLLYKLYPEHNASWRSVQLDILSSYNPVVDYPRIMENAFNIVARTLLAHPMTFVQARSTIEALGVDPQEYFSVHVCPTSNTQLALPVDVVINSPEY